MVEVFVDLSRRLEFSVCVRCLARVAHLVPDLALLIKQPIQLFELMLGKEGLVTPGLGVIHKEEGV